MAGMKRMMAKNATSLSINERFTSLRRNPAPGLVQTIRNNNALAQQISAKNRRLALQMERRPTVVAALRIKKKTLRQRLGQQPWDATPSQIAVAARPSFRGGRGRARGRGVGIVRRGLQRSQSVVELNRSLFGENSFRSQVVAPVVSFRGGASGRRGRGTYRGANNITISTRGQFHQTLRRGLSTSPRRGVSTSPRRSLSARGQLRGQALRRNLVVLTAGRGQTRGRGVLGQVQIRGQGRGQPRGQLRGQLRGQPRGQARGQIRGRGQIQVSIRGQRGVQRGRGGRGRGARLPAPKVSKEELDKQLDSYMSSTKSYLDNELDTYMTEV